MAPIATSPIPPSSPYTSSAISKTPKPILRRAATSGYVRTRDEAGLDFEDTSMSIPSSPTKRPRTVKFDPFIQTSTFSSKLTPAQLEAEQEAIRSKVRNALVEHVARSGSEAYDDIKSIFQQAKKDAAERRAGDKSENQEMRAHLLALTSHVNLLGKECNGLVRAIIGCEWLGRDESFVKIYVQFLGNLASAQGSYVREILNSFVDKFSGMRLSSGRLPDCPTVNREELSSRLHMAFRYLLRLIPSASSTLAPILVARFPWSDDSKKAHMNYIGNLLRLIEYAPELRSEVFALITERVVKIDVQMQTDLDDLDDDVAAAILHAITYEPAQLKATIDNEEEEDDESDNDSTTSDDMDLDSERLKQLQSNMEKMDAMLDTLFSIYEPYFEDPNSLAARSMFDTLLGHFQNIILPTYRSRHTQFLLFHFAQKSDILVDSFAGECVDLAFKSGRPAVLKQAAAGYLASFVSRGASVLPHTVREVFEFIGANLDKIRAENEPGCRGPDLGRYGTFYATTQALLYIFCFRWRDLIISEDANDIDDDDDYLNRDLEWLPGIKELLNRTIYSTLNPLKICAPSIVEEFARIAHHLKFMYVYPLLEKNKRVRLSQFALSIPAFRESGMMSASAEAQERWNQLDAYFPFDPYQLPVSRRWIQQDYVEWKDIPGLRPDEDDDDESTEGDLSSDDDEEEDFDEDTATDSEDDTIRL